MAEPNPLSDALAPRADNQDPALFGQTPWQTVGPFFHYGLPWKGGADLVSQSDMGARPELFDEAHWVLNLSSPKGVPEGEIITLSGRITDGVGQPVPDALVEIWQADARGRYGSAYNPREDPPRDPHFIGFGRASTDDDGVYRFRTVRPGAVPGPGGAMQAPHIAVGIMGRGFLKRLVTRAYFVGAPANTEDPILALVPDSRRGTLMARSQGDGWRFDIVLQGERETVFFEI